MGREGGRAALAKGVSCSLGKKTLRPAGERPPEEGPAGAERGEAAAGGSLPAVSGGRESGRRPAGESAGRKAGEQPPSPGPAAASRPRPRRPRKRLVLNESEAAPPAARLCEPAPRAARPATPGRGGVAPGRRPPPLSPRLLPRPSAPGRACSSWTAPEREI